MADATQDESVPSSRRWTIWLAGLVVVVLVVVGVVVALNRSTDQFAAARKAAIAELAAIGAPAGLVPAVLDGKVSKPVYDTWTKVASSSYMDQTGLEDTAASLDKWLLSKGFPRASGAAEAQTCGMASDSTAAQPRWTCGNFLRESASWRVWVQLTWRSGGNVETRQSSAADPVRMTVDVQPRSSLAASLSVPKTKGGAPLLRSPGLEGTVPAGQLRVLLDLPTDGAVDLYGVAFDPLGQLVMEGGLGGRHGAANEMPALMPVAAGSPVRQLTVSEWPTLPREASVPNAGSGSGSGGFASDIYAARPGLQGDWWLFGVALRRLTADGQTVNVMGAPNGFDAVVTDGSPAIGQPAYDSVNSESGLALTPDGSAWLATDALLQVKDGVVHVVDRRKATGVVDDGAGGIYFVTSAQVFHRSAGGSSVLVAGTGTAGHTGDGSAAMKATFDGLRSLAVAKDGSIFVLDGGRLRHFRQGGTVTSVVGAAAKTGDRYCAPLSAGTAIAAPYQVAASPLGGVFIAGCNRLAQVGY